jgi:hypothetical protein
MSPSPSSNIDSLLGRDILTASALERSSSESEPDGEFVRGLGVAGDGEIELDPAPLTSPVFGNMSVAELGLRTELLSAKELLFRRGLCSRAFSGT